MNQLPGGAPSADPTDGRSEAAQTGRRRGRRAGRLFVIAVALLFIGASAAQIIPAVFAPSAAGTAPDRQADGVAATCASGVRALESALDRASGAAWAAAATTGDFERALGPEWQEGARGEVERSCAASPEGLDAWTALVRLKRAHEQALLRDRADLIPLRREVGAHLPRDSR